MKTSINNNNELKGSQILLEALINEGIDTIFGYPGGQAIPIYDSLYDYKDKINHILVRHEQGAVHAAQGYARVSGKVGVTLVTSGPGMSNTITGIADAMMDSTPIVVIAGQVPVLLLGTDAFQEIDVIGTTQAITKWTYQIRSVEEISWAIARAFYIASTGRPGPVVLDFPKNCQVNKCSYKAEKIDFIRSYIPIPKTKTHHIETAVALIDNAKKPLILAGQGVILSNAEKELMSFAQKADIPVATTMLGLSAIPSNHKLNVGMIGMHGNIAPNIKTNEADVLIAVGMRFDDRVTGDLNKYAKQAKIIHFDIDSSEINKNVKVDIPILGDAKETLKEITKRIKENKHSEWRNEFIPLWEKEKNAVIAKELYPREGPLKMGEVVNKVSEATQHNAILVTDVGQNQMMGVRYFNYNTTRSVVTSGGLGTMGFGLPAAIGAKIGAPDRTVCLFVGDGGLQMSIQELGTIMQSNIGVKIILLNNSFLGMVRQWQELFFQERYSETVMQNPDFVKIAGAYNIPSRMIENRDELEDAIKEMLETDGAYLLEVKVIQKGNVYPMVPAGAGITEILLEE